MTTIFELKWSVRSEEEHLKNLQTLPKRRVKTTHRNNQCLVDECHNAEHMIVRYLICVARQCGKTCPVKYRFSYCEATNHWMCFQAKDTRHTHEPFNHEGIHSARADLRYHGLPIEMKQLVIDLYNEKQLKPYQVYVQLQEMFKRKEIPFMPPFKRIQNCVGYLKNKKSNEGKLNHIFEIY